MTTMDEKFVVCPFNKSHVISRLRIQYHIVKCKKNYPNCKKIICPYNATEYIDPDNFLQHLSQCKKSKGLDVTEGYKQKQFEFNQHGCVNNHTFQMPSHVEVTDEWDIASSDSNNSCDRTITRDERIAFRLRRQSSNAIKKSYSYIPFVPNSLGRGHVNEAIRQYLNRYEPPVKPVDKTAPVSLADCDGNGIYDDCDTFDTSNNDDEECGDEKQEQYDYVSCDRSTHNSDDNPTDENEDNASNYSQKYYKPSVGRGCGITRSTRGRGIPVGSIGRGITFNCNSSVSSASESFDYVLRQVVDTLFHRELLNDNRGKENTSSESSNGKEMDIVDINLRFENEKKFSLQPSDILSGNLKNLDNGKVACLRTKELVSEEMDVQLTSSSVLSSAKSSLNCSDSKGNNERAFDYGVLPCNVDSVPDECRTIVKEESTEGGKADDLKDRLDKSPNTSSPLSNYISFGRGKHLRSLNDY